MDTCGEMLKKLSIFILVAAIIVLCIGLFTSLSPINEEREEYRDDLLDHEEYYEYQDTYYHSKSDCNTCEELDEWRKNLNQATTLLVVDALYKLLLVGIGCGLLYGFGAVLEKRFSAATPTADKRYARDSSVPDVDSTTGLRSTMGGSSTGFCTRCGTALRPGSDYCGICGTTVKK